MKKNRLFPVLLLLTWFVATGKAMAADGKLYWNTHPQFSNDPAPHFTITTKLKTDSPQKYSINKVVVELYADEALTIPYTISVDRTTGAYGTLQSTRGFNKVAMVKKNSVELKGSGIGSWTVDIPTEALVLSDEYISERRIYVNTIIHYNNMQKMQDKDNIRATLANGKHMAWIVAKPKIVVPRITMEWVEGYWDPMEDQEDRFKKEFREHGVSSKGHGGYFAKISYDRHPNIQLPIAVRLSFWREEDVLHPKYPTDGSPVTVNGWSDMWPLTFKINENSRREEFIDYSFGEEHDNLPESAMLEFHRKDWKSFETFIPWELFNLYNLHPEVDELKVNIFVRAEVWRDENLTKDDIVCGRGMLGDNDKIPTHLFKRERTTVPENKIVDLGVEDFSDDSDESLLEQARNLMYDHYGKQRDYSEAERLLEEAISKDETGATDAVWELGVMYLNHQIEIVDGNADWMPYLYFKKSANAGNPIGFYWLARCYENGYGGVEKKDVQKAQDLYKAAYQKLKDEGNKHDPYVCQYLGFMEYYGMYKDNFAPAPQWEDARPWLEKAGNAGLAEAQYLLGTSYDKQIDPVIEGLHEDPVEAQKWYSMAASKGHADAQYDLGHLCERLSQNEGATDFSKNIYKRDAFKWYKESAEQNNVSALVALGKCYENGMGTAKDLQKAKECYQKAAELGSATAKELLEQ